MSLTETVPHIASSVVGLRRGARGGSGVVIAPGRVLTLAHHLRADEVEVAFAGGRTAHGAVVGRDPDLDLAVLEVDTGDAAPIRWAGDGAPGIGAPVIAAADPGGSGLRVTAGAVSAEPTRLRGRRGRPVEGVLEHTAPLPRGAGGGPLLDEDGAVLGINALRQRGGFILALPASEVRPRVDALLAGGTAEPRRLGVAIVPPRAARRMRRAVGLDDREGLLVRGVAQDGPAAAAGIQRGDLLVTADGAPLDGIDALYAALDGAPEDAQLVLGVVRGSEELEVPVTVPAASAPAAGEAPEDPS
jgi:S1-C subfamily serine protease